MLSPDGPTYGLADNIEQLHAVADAFAMVSHRMRLLDVAQQAVIEWYDPVRAVVRPRTTDETEQLHDSDDWHVTGLAAFANYGHDFHLPREPLFWSGPNDVPSGEQTVCHTILTDPEPRRVSYAMLLIEDAGLDHYRLRDLSHWYGVEDTLTTMLDTLEGNIDWPSENNIPGKQEYEALKTQYLDSR